MDQEPTSLVHSPRAGFAPEEPDADNTWGRLPPEVVDMIVDMAGDATRLSLMRVSKSVNRALRGQSWPNVKLVGTFKLGGFISLLERSAGRQGEFGAVSADYIRGAYLVLVSYRDDHSRCHALSDLETNFDLIDLIQKTIGLIPRLSQLRLKTCKRCDRTFKVGAHAELGQAVSPVLHMKTESEGGPYCDRMAKALLAGTKLQLSEFDIQATVKSMQYTTVAKSHPDLTRLKMHHDIWSFYSSLRSTFLVETVEQVNSTFKKLEWLSLIGYEHLRPDASDMAGSEELKTRVSDWASAVQKIERLTHLAVKLDRRAVVELRDFPSEEFPTMELWCIDMVGRIAKLLPKVRRIALLEDEPLYYLASRDTEDDACVVRRMNLLEQRSDSWPAGLRDD